MTRTRDDQDLKSEIERIAQRIDEILERVEAVPPNAVKPAEPPLKKA